MEVLLALLLFLVLFFLKVPTRTHLKRDRGSLLSSVLLPAIIKCPWGWVGVLNGFLDRGVPPRPSNSNPFHDKNRSLYYPVEDKRGIEWP